MRSYFLSPRQLALKLSSRFPPQLRFLPYPAIRIIALLILVNLIIWAVVAVVLRSHPLLASNALLSYTLGLRHALDADHISAIDLMTRRLVATGSKPVTVGTWFSLGHSTIVIITCIVVAATSGALERRFDGFRNVGNIIGTGVSASVLILLGIGNAWILWKLIQRMRVVLREEDVGDRRAAQEGTVAGLDLEGGGIMVRLFKKVFKFIDRPWKMYPLGVLFGLGFDTSSEIAVLGIASVQGAQGTSIWLILVFPVLFTGEAFFPSFWLLLVRYSHASSRYVSARHHRWSLDDDPLHLNFVSPRYRRHPLLLHYSLCDNCPRRHLHWSYSAPLLDS
jgi:high-affinity nickel-transport protein